MNEFANQFSQIILLFKLNLYPAAKFVLIFWVIHLLNLLAGYRLNYLGIVPRHIIGLRGIPFYTFLHGDFNHLLLNSIPLFILSDLIMVYGLREFIVVTLIIIILAGLAIWLFARTAIHIGASSLVMGYWGFLLMNAYQNPGVFSIILAAICLYYFSGNMLASLVPTREKVSWEGHLFGLLAGIAAIFLYPYFL